MPDKMDQRVAIHRAFTTLCAQYNAIGEQLKALSILITPLLNHQQDLVPPVEVELYTPAEMEILNVNKHPKNGSHPDGNDSPILRG